MDLFTLKATLGLDSTGFTTGINNAKKAAEGLGEDLSEMWEPLPGLEESLESTGDAAEKTGKQFGTMGETAKGTVVGHWLDRLIDKGVEWSTKSVTVASSLEELDERIGSTYSTENIRKIESFSRSANSSFGLNELKAKEYVASLGDLFMAEGVAEEQAVKMAIALSERAGDLASRYNITQESAYEKIQSGITGEPMPLRSVGVVMSERNLKNYAQNMGYAAYEDMQEAERLALRAEYILDKSTQSQGDFARTSTQFANSTRVLEGNLETLAGNVGSLLLPFLNLGANAANELVGGLNDVVYSVEDTAEALNSGAIFDRYSQEDIDGLNAYVDAYNAMLEAERAWERSGYGKTEELALTDTVNALNTAIENMDQTLYGDYTAWRQRQEEDGRFTFDILPKIKEDSETDLQATLDDTDLSTTVEMEPDTEAVYDAVDAMSFSAPVNLYANTSSLSGSALHRLNGNQTFTSHAVGLDYVPYDDYPARLHVGEAVLTKAEATEWRRGNAGGGMNDSIVASIGAAVSDAVRGAFSGGITLRIGDRDFNAYITETASRGIANEIRRGRYAAT